MSPSYRWLCLSVALLYCCEAYHILVVFPIPGKSHSILGEGHVRALLEAGHEVTYITAIPVKTNSTKYHEVDVSTNDETFSIENVMSISKMMKKEFTLDPRTVFDLLSKLNVATMENPNVVKLMNSDVKFDAAIIEWMFSETNIGYAAVFDCPFIYFGSTDPHTLTLRLIDDSTNPNVLSGMFSNNSPPFNFFQRAEELFMQIVVDLMKEFYVYYHQKQSYEYFGTFIGKKGRKLPPFNEFRYSAALMLGNSHVSLGTSHSLPQSYKPIGGYHIQAHQSPLPEDLKRIMDDAEHGVIYFSLGSMLKSKDLPYELQQHLLQVLGSLKYTVLWKFEQELENKPKNVHILKWAPQPAILSHPNCILFITHGGLLSSTEAIHYGVPIIGVPVFGDQPTNVNKAVNKGYALHVPLSVDMAGELKAAINEMTSNPKYAKRAKELSLVYHDRPVPPAKELVHWVEHVVKTKGARHLRSPALLVSWYQKMYLDFIAMLLIVIIIIVKLANTVFSSVCGNNKVSGAKKNK